MTARYDVIVVGARCAGASIAMLLARKGYRVLLLDRGTFPSDIPHGHFIHRHGPRRLRDWGLLDKIVATGCPPVTSITLDFGEFPLVGHDLVLDGVAAGYGPRRRVLDQILVSAAQQAGAELREGVMIEQYLADGDRIVGVRGRDRAGTVLIARAPMTVGADGRHSRLARMVNAAQYAVTATLLCWYFSYWAGTLSRGLELYVRDQRAIFAHPTHDGLLAVFIGWPIDEHSRVKSDLERQFMAALDGVPELAERVRSGARVERFYGAANLPNFLRTPAGPGWALVGDAGCHKDPYLALGICDAFRDAELLAKAIDQGLSSRRPIDNALAEYERRRNEATMPDFYSNLELARFAPLAAEQRRLLRSILGNQQAINGFLMAREGMIAHEAFLSWQFGGHRRGQADSGVGSDNCHARDATPAFRPKSRELEAGG